MPTSPKHRWKRPPTPWLIAAGVAGAAMCAWLILTAGPSEAERLAEIECLAGNVYYESRGEPLAGQYAVAEVTMNRVASPLFPSSVCDVVHAGRFDPIRGRYVGAFSWTEFDELERPRGYEWRRAMAVASTVYDNNLEAPLVNGALFYHATRVKPDWARTKTRVAHIGRHLFYE